MKSSHGRFLEDFSIGEVIHHATPRTLTEGDISLYTALYGNRFAPQSSERFAMDIGYPAAPIDDLLVFHTVFGKSVPDISLNAVANLGYAECRFLQPVFAGDSLYARSEVIGIKQNSNGKTGVVSVHTQGFNQNHEEVLTFKRWVMVRKKSADSVITETLPPKMRDSVAPDELASGLPDIDMSGWNFELSGENYRWQDYRTGEKIDHIDGMTVEEAEHQLATRLYQNTARVHFNHFSEAQGRFGKRLIYGGHVISLARSLSFNGLANVFHIAAINGGRHIAPLFAGDTVFAWSEVLDRAECGRDDVAALRLRLVASKNRPCHDFPLYDTDGKPQENVILDVDYWGILPR